MDRGWRVWVGVAVVQDDLCYVLRRERGVFLLSMGSEYPPWRTEERFPAVVSNASRVSNPWELLSLVGRPGRFTYAIARSRISIDISISDMAINCVCPTYACTSFREAQLDLSVEAVTIPGGYKYLAASTFTLLSVSRVSAIDKEEQKIRSGSSCPRSNAPGQTLYYKGCPLGYLENESAT
ncbi:hypothetical protein BDZ97DRAFT_1761505 [Flammula alnicola]|nr:hypothetical protein BDZ97DRAFT_1761505 [Flammula alnicola]